MRLNDEVLAPGVVPESTVATGVATAIATGGMLPRGADAVVMVEHTEFVASGERRVVEIRRSDAGRERQLLGHRHRPRGNGAAARDSSSPRARSACWRPSGSPRSPSIAGRGSRSSPPATRSWRRAVRCAPGPSTIRTRRSSARRSRSWAERRCTSASSPTTTRRLPPPLARGLRIRPRRLLGRHVEGCGRSVLPRGEQPARPGRRRSRGRAQARQADLPRGHRRKAGRDPARISDVRDLHVPRVSRAGDPRLRRPAAGAPADRVAATLPMRVNSERGRTEYLLVGLVQGERRARGLSDGQGFRVGDDVQRCRRLHHDRSAHRDPRSGQCGRRCSSSDSDSSPPTW